MPEVTDDGWINSDTLVRGDLAIELPFPAVVRGHDANNREFEEETVLESLRPGRVSLTLARPVIGGEKLPTLVRLSLADDDQIPALRLAFEGVVITTEWLGEGRWRMEMDFRRYRLIYASDATWYEAEQ